MQKGRARQSFGLLDLMKHGHAPAWLRNWHSAPKQFQDLATTICQSPGNLQPDPVKAFNVFASSGLPGPVLSHLWSIVHPLDDPSFELPEFFAVLALIGIVQRTNDPNAASLAALMSMAIPPLPNVSQPTPVAVPKVPPPSELNFDFGFSPPTFDKITFPLKPCSEGEDEFGDFQASNEPPLASVVPKIERTPSPLLMASSENEDKYAVFRALTDLSETSGEPTQMLNPLDEPVLEEVPNLPTPVTLDDPSSVPEISDPIPALPEVATPPAWPDHAHPSLAQTARPWPRRSAGSDRRN